jgi:predicted nuclease with RNAse H fold
VAADDVILKLVEVLVIDAPLCHRAETSVDAIDDLVLRKSLQEVEAVNDVVTCSLVDCHAVVLFYD